MHHGTQKPLLVVLGPTASGKTNFSLRLAEKIGDVEIVNADSRQLYKFLNIGTAKIKKEEMQGVPHHLFDVLDPTEEITIAKYKEMATAVTDDILSRGKQPMLVGGSMLYLSSIIDGLEPLPVADPGLRARLERAYDADRGASLYARLQEEDPDAALSIHQNNRPYVIRAMELCETTGGKPSALKRRSQCPYELEIFGMLWPREELHRRIAERTRELLEHGWVEEVAGLRERGFTADDPAMKSHGYREILSALERCGGTAPCITHVRNDSVLRETIIQKTRQYAKRQMTWWRSDARIQWIDPLHTTPSIVRPAENSA